MHSPSALVGNVIIVDFLMADNSVIEIKSEGEFFTTLVHYLLEVPSFIEVIKYESEDFVSIIKYYYKFDFLHTHLSHYILSVSFGSLLSKIVYLLPQINVSNNMCTAGFAAHFQSL